MAFARRFMVVGAKGSVILLARLLRNRLGEEGASVAAGLLADSGSIASAEYGLRLRELAVRAEESERARRCLGEGNGDWESLPETDPFRREFSAFLEEFGHRTVHESDIARPRWREDAGYLLSRIRADLERRPGNDLRQPARIARQNAEAKLSALPFGVRIGARWLARRARRGTVLRDDGKSTLVACVGALRAAYLEVGRRLVRAGRLAATDDVFDLTQSDLEAFMRGEWDGAGARELAADRKAQCEAWRATSPGDVSILDARGRKVDSPTQFGAREPGGSPRNAELRGIPASPGRVTGRARVVSHPDDGAAMVDGEVLVAPSTEPSWTPHLLRASALVTELGGYLSHGTIVARERGLPAVVNVPGATQRLQDGQSILVDGDRGVIRILSSSGTPL
jgi:pyruvate,water dikinase